LVVRVAFVMQLEIARGIERVECELVDTKDSRFEALRVTGTPIKESEIVVRGQGSDRQLAGEVYRCGNCYLDACQVLCDVRYAGIELDRGRRAVGPGPDKAWDVIATHPGVVQGRAEE